MHCRWSCGGGQEEVQVVEVLGKCRSGPCDEGAALFRGKSSGSCPDRASPLIVQSRTFAAFGCLKETRLGELLAFRAYPNSANSCIL